MAIKIKETPKPALNKKKHSKSPAVVSSTQKKTKGTVAVSNEKKKDSALKTPNNGKSTVSENVKLSDMVVSSICELKSTQVENAVKASFEAFKVAQQKSNGGKLFESDPEPIILLVSAIKIPNDDPHPLYVQLPEPFLDNDSDICLIVKDLEKGWKVDHEPTIHHYQELLQSKKVSCVSEIMPLRQLRVEYKPYEARNKLSKRFDTVLVDRKVAKFVPRYLGKSFYQAGRLPIPLDLEAKDLLAEFNKAVATSTMSMSYHGASTQIQVGLSNQTESAIAKNILAVHQSIEQNFPGKFANIRSLSLRFGNSKWNVPIYISYANRDSVKLPTTRKRTDPLIDDLTTLAPGWNIAVYPSGEVKKVKVQDYEKSKLDLAIEDPELDIEIENTADNEEEKVESSVKKPGKAHKTATGAAKKAKQPDIEEPQLEKKKATNLKKKKSADDSSEDEGDALEEEYMKELDMLEEVLVDEPNEETDPEPKQTKGESKVKIAKKSAPKRKAKK